MATRDETLPASSATAEPPLAVVAGAADAQALDTAALALLHTVQGVQETVLAARMLAEHDAGLRRRLLECAVGTVLDHLLAPVTVQRLVPHLARRAMQGQGDSLGVAEACIPRSANQAGLQLDSLFCDLFALMPGAPVAAARPCLGRLLMRIHGQQARGGVAGAQSRALRQQLLAGLLRELAGSG